VIDSYYDRGMSFTSLFVELHIYAQTNCVHTNTVVKY